ncbi:MAG: S8 family serine peptidase [Limisphaerales bacterium]
MRFSSRTWSFISLALLFAGAFFLWLDRQLAPVPVERPVPAMSPASARDGAGVGRQSPFALLSQLDAAGSDAFHGQAETGSGEDPAVERDPYLLVNTGDSVDALARRESAILLENAFLDTDFGTDLAIPAHLQAGENPGGFVVQFRSALNRELYDLLSAEGAEFVAYVPNNAALVRASDAVAEGLAAHREVRTVIPFAPYYKLSRRLLSVAVEEEWLNPQQLLSVVLYPGVHDEAVLRLTDLGVSIEGETRSPFGPVMVVRSPGNALVELARLPEVQRIETAHQRVLLNDLARVRVGVTQDASINDTNGSYLGLSGAGVLVNVNDSGVDREHPGLAGRVTTSDTNSFVMVDPSGHGTHVAGTLAGDGAMSESVSNVVGSLMEPLFSGVATQAEVYVLPIDLALGPLVSDIYMQEEAATEYYSRRGETNLLVSNNSWNYLDSYAYDVAAVSYDAASRDALPDVPGMQPVLFVFSAGNSGRGGDNGLRGQSGTIGSPATAKNVITVGAIEQPRFITNAYYITNIIEGTTNEFVITNAPFLAMTDSDNEVASYSSRGNVGVGREGEHGRFKPDVVAPGSFMLSARSAAWDLNNDWATNNPSYPVVEALTTNTEPYYRFESGTSMSAPVVSGMLALMQEFYETSLKQGYSAALLKALLIHGTRPVNVDYNLEVKKILNHQGWGLPHLTNSIVPEMDSEPEEKWSTRYFADAATNVLATGQSHTWIVTLTNDAQYLPFRATLVWTDPPGNPGAAIKLVNDLDLVITNLVTKQVFWGNYIVGDSDFNSPRETNTIPVSDVVNNVENVIMPGAEEASTNAYQVSVTVLGRKVNVNSVTANTNNVVQDYALVITAGDNFVTNAIESVEWQAPAFDLLTPRVLTNGVAVIQQRAGANFQLAPGTNGVANQWSFYVFTNTFFTNQAMSGLTNGSNVAFITFLPPNLSKPRNFQSDIDLYVTKDPGLLLLDPLAVAGADKSLSRGGTELIVYTNATTSDIFYVGVKAEDQQASEFGLVVQSTDLPFSDEDEFGNQRLYARGLPVAIPDGSNEDPGGVLAFAFPMGEPVGIVNAMAQPTFRHENIGDLVGILSHDDQYAVLQNHNTRDDLYLTLTNYYPLTVADVIPQPEFVAAQSRFGRNMVYSDGPGSLKNFIGQTSQGVWMFSVVDEGANNVGSLDELTILLTPNELGDDGVVATVPPNEWVYFFTNVPPEAVSLTAALSAMSPTLPLDLYLRREQLPDFDLYDKMARIPGDGGSLTITREDSPPLNAGQMFIGVYNPNDQAVTFRLQVTLELDLNAVNRGGVQSKDTPLPVLDDAVTRSEIFVPEERPVLDVRVGVRTEHARASDLVFHLISPQGTRILLAENRGSDSTNGYGATLFKTNVVSRTSTGGPEEDRQVIHTGVRQGILKVDYQFYVVPDRLTVYYDGQAIFKTGLIGGSRSFTVPFGPGTSTNLMIVVNEGGSTAPSTTATRWTYTAEVFTQSEFYTVFTEETNLTTLPVKFATGPFTNSLGSVVGTNRSVYVDGFENYATGIYSAPMTLGSWSVSRGDVAVHADAAEAFEGTNYVELIPGVTPAALSVDVNTVQGAHYAVTMFLKRNPDVPAGVPQAVGIYVDNSLASWIQVENDAWEQQGAFWFAGGGSTHFEIRTASGGGALVDTVALVEILEGGEAYFLPEEDLMRPLEGESPFGTWTLEMIDDRVGGSIVPTPELLSWTLSFIFANTNPPVTPLLPCQLGDTLFGIFDTACVQQTNYIANDEIQYFSVQAPLAASAATNVLLKLPELSSGSGGFILMYNTNGLPTGNNPTDVIISTGSTNGEVLVLTTNTVPPLIQGQRYYLGVMNAQANETNAFHITAEFDAIDTALITAPFLTNGIPVTNTVPATTNVMQYYQFRVESTNTTHVMFELLPQDGNADLYLRKATAVPNPLPRPIAGEFDYASLNPTNAADWIIITRRSIPVPLDNGLWYLGVMNTETNSVTYNLEAREYADLVTLGDRLPQAVSMPSTNGFRYFEFEVSEYASGVEVRLDGLDGNLDMYVSRVFPGSLPFPDAVRYGFAGENPGVTDEVVWIDYFTDPFLQPGWYYVAVANRDGADVNGVLTVTQDLTIPPNVIPLVDGVPTTYSIPAGEVNPTYFLLSVPVDRSAALFEVYGLNQAAELLLEYAAPPVPGFAYRSSLGDPVVPPQIVLRTSSGDPASLLGDWYLQVRPSVAQDLSFTIRAVTSSNGVLLSGRAFGTQLSIVSPTEIKLDWNTVDGERYEVARSTDMVNWTVLTTVVASGRTASFADTTWTGGQMVFYRILQVP